VQVTLYMELPVVVAEKGFSLDELALKTERGRPGALVPSPGSRKKFFGPRAEFSICNCY